jgi:hypothetical protein
MTNLRSVLLALGSAAVGVACSPASQPPAQDGAVLLDQQILPPADGAVSVDATVTPADGGSPADAGPPVAPTWWNSIKALTDQTCNNCHQPGGIAPMPLQTYEQARAMSRVMARQTRDRIMPPWMPRDGCRDLVDHRGLTDAEIALFAAWDAAGAPEGNMEDFRPATPRANTSRPLPARPGDVIVQPADPYLPNQRQTDDYHCFIVDPALATTRDVVGVRVVPGNARIVHHMLLFEVRAAGLPALQRLDDAEPGPGYTCFGTPGVEANPRAGTNGDLIDVDMQQVAGWAPGGVDGYMPNGTGIRLKPGSRLVMQVHYNLQMATRGMTDRTRVELFLGEPGTTQQALWLPQSNNMFRVPAGAGPTEPASTAVANFRNMLPLRIFGVFPHMHQRGHAIRVEAVNAAGTSNCLVDVPRWDFHWQQNYFFRTPYRPAAGNMGDTLRTTCVWDNRPENQPFVDGMQVAPRELRWGEGSDDEMCLNYFYVSL